MSTLVLLLSIYASIISTILFARWMRLLILKRNVRKQIERDSVSPEKQEFLVKHPPIFVEQKEEMEGMVVTGFEVEMDRMESEEVEESIEEREYQEEEMIKSKRGARR